MTKSETDLGRIYRLTLVFGVAGFVSYFCWASLRPAFAFAVGVLGSFLNLWVFDKVSGAIAPGENTRKPWQAGLFIGRYAILLAVGYVIVKTLNVSPLAVVLGLLASTAAVLTSLILELVQSFTGSRRAH